jgi:ubiquinone/menaquinone biosynthesis C-methylase UbiE
MTTTDIRQHVHGMWASVADAWDTYAGLADEVHAEATTRMLEITAPRPGERVLELACGAGGAGLAAARLVEPGGDVVLSDVVPAMVAAAGRRAVERGLTNVQTKVIDLDQIGEPDAAYDVVLCREGLMFAFDPAAAAAQIARVLRPGGRVGIAVWGPRAANPWLSVVFDAASEVLGAPVPPPGLPGPFALADREHLAAILAGAGLAQVSVAEIIGTRRDTTFEQWWTRTTALAGPLAQRLAALPDAVKDGLKGKLREAVRPYRSADGLAFPSLNLLATASK